MRYLYKHKEDCTDEGKCLQGENDVEVGKLASWQVGNARILNSNYYNSLIINDSNIL